MPILYFYDLLHIYSHSDNILDLMYVFKKLHSRLIFPNEKKKCIIKKSSNKHTPRKCWRTISSCLSKKHSTDLKWDTINFMIYEFMPQNYMNFTWPGNKKLFSLQLSTAKEGWLLIRYNIFFCNLHPVISSWICVQHSPATSN